MAKKGNSIPILLLTAILVSAMQSGTYAGEASASAPIPAGRTVIRKVPVIGDADMPVPARQDLSVLADGLPYPGEVRLSDGTAWVALREFTRFADGSGAESQVCWDGVQNAATVSSASLALKAVAGDRILTANGRALLCPEPVRIENDVLWVPLRTLSRAFGYQCTYDPDGPAALLTRLSDAVEPRDETGEDQVFWLSRIIEAEAGAEPFEGKLAVGSVILNRVGSDEFPDTVWGVIFDDCNGVQFSPTENGTIWTEPGEDSLLAARITLDNPPVWDDIEYFLNPALASSLWIPASREYAFTIGSHEFYY